jgi:hypothetical protein
MSSAPCDTFISHALAVFRCSSVGNMTGALAAAALWQQQQPCLLSSSLLQWLTTQTETPVNASQRPADGAVYSSGASAFDLFASNGGNVRYLALLCFIAETLL